MEVFGKAQSAAQRDELKQWVSLTLGQSAWEDLVRTEARLENGVETLYAQRERRRDFIESWWVILSGAGISSLQPLFFFSRRTLQRRGTLCDAAWRDMKGSTVSGYVCTVVQITLKI